MNRRFLARSARLGRPRRRRGKLSLEFIFVLPILLIASIAVFQFGVAMVIRQAVVHSATVGAREAGKGADADELVEVVDTVIGVHGIFIGDHASLIFEDGLAPPEMRGTFPCGPPVGLPLDADQVRVTVCVDMAAKPFINPLRYYGIDFAGKHFQISSVVEKEGVN